MKWIDKLERRFGWFAIPNLTLYIVICYVIGFMILRVRSELMNYLSLDMVYVFRGQIWRLVTWILFPPSGGNVLLFALAILFFYYPIGTSLERTWGSFRYTLYIFSGLLFTVLAALLLYLFTGNIVTYHGVPAMIPGSIFTTYYISLSVFLAYAMSYPDMSIYLWFVIPIKMRWMAVVYGLIVVYDMINYIRSGLWFLVIPIVASLLNFVIYYFSMKDLSRYNPRDVQRRREFRRAMEPQGRAPGQGQISKHKCAVCGRTELDDPNLEFRFCSRCKGNYEYCNEHLFTHEHVQ